MKKLKQIGILIWFIFVPLGVAQYYINQITFEKTVDEFTVDPKTVRVVHSLAGIETEPNPPTNIKSGEIFQGFDQIFRFSELLNIPIDAVRHEMYFKHNFKAKIKYTYQGANSKDSSTDIFTLALICNGKIIAANQEWVLSNLKLNSAENNDREKIENIISKCLYAGSVTLLNDKGSDIEIVPNDIQLLPNNSASLQVQPDNLSKWIIRVEWLIFWIGFWVLIKEGPFKYLKEIKA